MSISVTPQRFEDNRELPVAKPLDEAAWQAWVLKGRARDQRSQAARLKAVKWITAVGLLLAAELWPQLAPYNLGVRFLVAAGAMVLMFEAFHTRDYAFGALFGALAVLYNPVTPLFGSSGEWQRALLLASTVPFVASLMRRTAKLVPNE
jgi:hypothetical protein